MFQRFLSTYYFNGRPTPFFTLSWGIGQGETSSPYLFVICTEGFPTFCDTSSLMHLFLFVNESLLFKEATIASKDALKLVIPEYEEVLSQSDMTRDAQESVDLFKDQSQGKWLERWRKSTEGRSLCLKRSFEILFGCVLEGKEKDPRRTKILLFSMVQLKEPKETSMKDLEGSKHQVMEE